MQDELPGQLVEDFRMAGLVVVLEVVERLDDAGAEEVGPEAIDDGLRELVVIGAGDPFRQRGAGIDVGLPLRFLAVEEQGLGDAVGAGDGQLAAIGQLADLDQESFLGPSLDAGEERGHVPELVARFHLANG